MVSAQGSDLQHAMRREIRCYPSCLAFCSKNILKPLSLLRNAHTLSSQAAAPTLKGEEVGVIAIASQAEVWPPNSITFVCVQNKLPLCQLHNPRAQLVALIVNICHLQKHQNLLSGAPGIMPNCTLVGRTNTI